MNSEGDSIVQIAADIKNNFVGIFFDGPIIGIPEIIATNNIVHKRCPECLCLLTNGTEYIKEDGKRFFELFCNNCSSTNVLYNCLDCCSNTESIIKYNQVEIICHECGYNIKFEECPKIINIYFSKRDSFFNKTKHLGLKYCKKLFNNFSEIEPIGINFIKKIVRLYSNWYCSFFEYLAPSTIGIIYDLCKVAASPSNDIKHRIIIYQSIIDILCQLKIKKN